MRIFLVSDMHYEFGRNVKIPNLDVDLVVLAGDIESAEKVYDVATKFKVALRAPVVIVAGNHEFYNRDFEKMLNRLRGEKRFGIHFLENDLVTIGNTRILGCTLWSNFQLYGPDAARLSMREVERGITDFRIIRYGNRPLMPEDVANLFASSYQWLDKTLSVPFSGKTVVVTHFSPHLEAVHPKYRMNGIDYFTPYFTSDCSELMRRHHIDAWLYGHTHNSVDVIVDGGTRLVSNQGGYPGEDSDYVQFNPTKIIEVI